MTHLTGAMTTSMTSYQLRLTRLAACRATGTALAPICFKTAAGQLPHLFFQYNTTENLKIQHYRIVSLIHYMYSSLLMSHQQFIFDWLAWDLLGVLVKFHSL